jgi:hypothetical protein
MISFKPNSIVLLIGMIWVGPAQAQQSANASGGDATGNGGSVAYSIGQAVYTTNTGNAGTVAQGVQQPYEISDVSGIDNPSFNIVLSAYPNPTVASLTLNLGNADLSTLNFELYEANGKILERRKILSSSEVIKLDNLPSATYFLKVSSNNNEIRTFKVIKN